MIEDVNARWVASGVYVLRSRIQGVSSVAQPRGGSEAEIIFLVSPQASL